MSSFCEQKSNDKESTTNETLDTGIDTSGKRVECYVEILEVIQQLQLFQTQSTVFKKNKHG